MCRLLGVSPSGYYAWKKRQPSRRTQTDAALVAEIRAAHAASHGIYGAPRIHVDLAAKGIRVGRKRVARLMSAAGLAGVSRRKFVHTTVKGSGRQAPDLVDRQFTAERPNLLWVADITYLPTWAGFLYLAVDLVTTMAPAQIDPNAAFECSSQPPSSRCCDDRLNPPSTPPLNSATAAARPACGPRWDRSETPTTMRCARASSPRW